MKSFIVWVAQGFGVGRIPVAPGTFGSLVGLLWWWVLVASGSFWIYVGGCLFGLGISIWICGQAEKILLQHDPGSVVLDEIAAIPVCYLVWVGAEWMTRGHMAGPEYFVEGKRLVATAVIWVLFRAFDILKPWPVRQSQHLPGGWGVTVDDFCAAVYVAVCTLVLVA